MYIVAWQKHPYVSRYQGDYNNIPRQNKQITKLWSKTKCTKVYIT